MAEGFENWTPYHYVHNNPIYYIDPNGMYAPTGVKENEDGSYSVVGARNDKDRGVYIADGNKDRDIHTSERIAYTQDSWTFLIPDDLKGDLLNDLQM